MTTEFVVDVLYTTVFDHDNELVFTHTFTDEKNDDWFEQDFRSRDLFRDIQMVISDMIKMGLSGRCEM